MLALAMFAGCASDFPWRQDWPALPEPDLRAGCPVLDGVYANRGESAYRYAHDSSDLLLSVRLVNLGPKTGGTMVRLHQSTPDTLEVVMLESNGQEYSRKTLQRTQGDFECEAGMLWLRGTTTVMKDGTGIGSNTQRLGLMLAVDGTLAGKQHSYGAAAIGWIVPLVESQDIWYRWDRVSN